jgi:hypothetical protein
MIKMKKENNYLKKRIKFLENLLRNYLNKKPIDDYITNDLLNECNEKQNILLNLIPDQNLEVIYHAVIKFLEYGCTRDMRIISDVSYGTIGALRSDRSVSFQYTMIIDKPIDNDPTSYNADQLLFDTVAAYNIKDKDVYYNNYVCLEIMCEHETDILGSLTKVIFGNVTYVEFNRPGEFDTCRVGERENKKIRFEVFIDKIKKYVHAHDDINAWLILQGITL